MAEKISVLYVDDEPELLDIGKLFLEESGDFSVTTIDSAVAAISLISNENFDAIISDYQMPGMDGIKFLIEVRTKFGQIPFILFTGKGREEVVIQAINNGADFYLQKGGDPTAQFVELAHKVKKAVKEIRADEAIRTSYDRFTKSEANLGIHKSELETQAEELKRANLELGESRDKYLDLYEFAPLAYFMLSDKALIINVNLTGAILLGLERGNLVKVPFSKFLSEKDADQWYRYFMNVLKQDNKQVCTLTLRRVDGSTFPARLESIRLTGECNVVSTVRVAISDISDIWTLTQSLKESEEKFQSLYMHMIEGAALHEIIYSNHGIPEDYIILETNPAFEKQLGITRALVIGKTSREAYGVDTPPYLDIYAKVAMTGEPEVFETYFSPVAKYFSISVYCPVKGRFATIFEDITERKMAERELRESEGLIKTVVSNLHGVVFSVDKVGIFLLSDGKSLSSLGLTPGQVVGQSVFDVYKDVPEVVAGMKTALSGKLWSGIIHVQDIFFDTFVTPVFDSSGMVSGAVGIATDITERQKTELELVSAQQRLAEVHRLAHIGTWDWVIETDTVTWSEELCHISGWDPEKPAPSYAELPGIYTPASWDILSAAVTRALSTGEPYNLELELVRPDGNIRWTNAFGKVQRDGNGNITGLHGSLQDITERKLAEDALHNTNEYLQNLLDYANAPIIVWDQEFLITRFNHAFEDLTLRSEQEVIGQRLDILFPKESRDSSLLQIKKTLLGEQWETVEIPILIKDGSVRIVIWNSANILDSDGRVISTIAQGIDITERKRAEAASTESFATFRTVMDSLDALVYVADMKTFEILFVNQYGRKIWGDLTGKICWESLQSGQKGPCPFCTNEKLLDEEGHPTGIIVWEFRNTITGQWYECHDSAIQWIDGRIVRLEIATDITGRKRVQEALAESESFNRGLVENLPDYIAVYGMDGKLLYVNPASARTLGYDASTLIGTHVLSYIAEEYQETVIAKMTARKEGDEASPYEIELVTRNGSRRSVIVKATPIQYQNNFAVLLLLIDITDRQMAEDALQRSEEKFRQLFTQMPSAVAIYEAIDGGNDFTFKNFNTAAEKIEGIKKEDLLGKRVSEVFPGVKDFGVFSVFQRVWKTGEPEFFPSAVYRDERDIGTWRESWVYRLGGGEVIAIYNDITERKLAEKALEQANRKLTLLTSITRHDILNQLTVLIGHLELLERKQPDPSFTTYFNKISRAADRINAMIRFTKEYEQIGVHAPTWQDCRTLVDTAAKQAPLGMVMVENDLPADMTVFADQLITKVFYNLMDNAGRYGGKITTIRFSALKSGDDPLILCEDDGVGIPADEKEKIFERGFGKNTGLGLALSREILSITGITITETGEPGKGARFEMVVPDGMWRMAGKGT